MKVEYEGEVEGTVADGEGMRMERGEERMGGLVLWVEAWDRTVVWGRHRWHLRGVINDACKIFSGWSCTAAGSGYCLFGGGGGGQLGSG